MSAWNNLPNAYHIDGVIASLKEYPQIWGAVYVAISDEAWDEARDAALNEAWNVSCNTARKMAWHAAWDDVWNSSYDATRDAILALIAYDDCDQYLSMTSEELRAWSLLTEHPAAVLLLPAVVAFERIKELESV
jgi:hypothetical protein